MECLLVVIGCKLIQLDGVLFDLIPQSWRVNFLGRKSILPLSRAFIVLFLESRVCFLPVFGHIIDVIDDKNIILKVALVRAEMFPVEKG
jgi:hypothetical protein